ncbi:deoxyribose-phosphate aldolase [Ureaplasma ceti]|uniref:Deoxyribose-phosphate aldolase n=1 Tax=Ureaplasma ceti TaxID=3119530 RepID=A0ABP9UDX8_9BACT
MEKYTQAELAKFIDHTNLSDVASKADIEKLCNEAKEYGFKSVCVNPFYVNDCKRLLVGTDVLVCTVIGFPLGMNTIENKVFETLDAVKNGADEIDMVINIAKLKARDESYCLKEINAVKSACHHRILKVIVETSQLTQEDKVFACELIAKSDANFIKTSTGFVGAGAQLEDVQMWHEILGNKKEIKAAGGVRTYADLLKFIEAGATRIGSSKGISLITNEADKTNSGY